MFSFPLLSPLGNEHELEEDEKMEKLTDNRREGIREALLNFKL